MKLENLETSYVKLDALILRLQWHESTVRDSQRQTNHRPD